jgi:hypothetical protein
MCVFLKGFFASIEHRATICDNVFYPRGLCEAAYMSGFTNLILFIPRYFINYRHCGFGIGLLAPSMAISDEAAHVTHKDTDNFCHGRSVKHPN